MAGLMGIPPVPIGAGTINFADSKEKRPSSFKIVNCPDSDLDPNKLFSKEAIVRRIAELERLAHQHSVNMATALEATFQVKMSVSPNDPE